MPASRCEDYEALRAAIQTYIGKKSVKWILENVWPAAEGYAKDEWWDIRPRRFWSGPRVEEVCREEAAKAIAKRCTCGTCHSPDCHECKACQARAHFQEKP